MTTKKVKPVKPLCKSNQGWRKASVYGDSGHDKTNCEEFLKLLTWDAVFVEGLNNLSDFDGVDPVVIKSINACVEAGETAYLDVEVYGLDTTRTIRLPITSLNINVYGKRNDM